MHYVHMHSEHMLPVITAYVITVSTVLSIAIVSLATSSLNKRCTLSQKIFLYMCVCMYMTMTLHSQPQWSLIVPKHPETSGSNGMKELLLKVQLSCHMGEIIL